MVSTRTMAARACTAAVCLTLAACTSTGEAPPAGATAAAEPRVAAAAAPGAPSGHERMLALLRDIVRRVPDEHVYLGDSKARALRAALGTEPPLGDPRRLGQWIAGSYTLGMAELTLGNERESIERLRRAYELLPRVRSVLQAGAAEKLVFRLGLAHLRMGETQNCCARKNADSCILPIRGGGVHANPEGSRRALPYLLEVLESTAADAPLHLQARWLLNLAHMTLGSYPDDVPEEHRIPPQAFASAVEFPRFPEIAGRVGLDTFNNSGGAIAEDFDGDGDLDIVTSSYHPADDLRFFRNEGDGTFVDRSAEAGLTGLSGGLNLVQADYDNDGATDFLVLRGAWLVEAGRHPNSLVRNNGDGTFTDVTFEAGLGRVHYPTQTAAWADYDNDGDLDLYVGNESLGGFRAPGQLFRNEADGTFADVAAAAGVTNERMAKAVVWGDYDGDALPDLYVSNLRGANRLYRNRGDGTFADVAPAAGVTGPEASFPSWFFDYDNDGDLDLYVAAYEADIAALAADYLGLDLDVERARLYRNDGGGTFRDVAAAAGVARPSAPMGANFGDLEGDGWLDFYLGTGYPDYKDVMPNVMYRNREGHGFDDVTFVGGFGHLQKGHAVVFADLDHDGDVDVFEQMGGALAGDRFRDALYENPGFGNRWIVLRLEGVTSNRSAIGVRIRVDVDGRDGPRSIYRHVTSGGSFGASPLRQTIGLGRAERIVRVRIDWPASGTFQEFDGVPLESFVHVVEHADTFRAESRAAFVLGGAD